VAQKIQEAVAGLKIPHREGLRQGVVTVSLGVASSEDGACTGPEGLLAAADQACYLAKQEGRDMVMTAGED
jgi:diguanylate cyclase (GGDEF)-like protein